jgi:NADH-quinone oxidoreductase subunit F
MTTNPGPCAIVSTDNLKPEILDRLEAVIAGRRATPGNLLPVLHAAQEIMGYVPAPMQAAIAAGLNLPGSDIFGTMSFYSMFTWQPRGKYIVRMCQSPPCHVNGAENMLQALQAELGLAAGQTTADGLFTL